MNINTAGVNDGNSNTVREVNLPSDTKLGGETTIGSRIVELLNSEVKENISINKFARLVGVNVAQLYLIFKSVDIEISTYVAVGKKYSDDVISKLSEIKTVPSTMDTNFEIAKFYHADLKEINFHDSKFNNANFYNANLSSAKFVGCNLNNVYMSYANLTNALFCNICAIELKISHANCNKATFLDVVLSYHHVKSSWFVFSVFENVRFDCMIFLDSNFMNAEIENCNFSSTNFKKCNFMYSKFTETNLKYSRFMKSYLRNASFYNCDLHGVDLCGSDISDVLIEDSDLSEAFLNNKYYERLVIKNCNLKDTRIPIHMIKNIEFIECDISQVKIVDIDVDVDEDALAMIS